VANLQRNLTNATAAGHLLGVDVSVYQGSPAQWVGEAGNFSWAAVKITELEPKGSKNPKYVNPDRAADWDWLGTNKKGRIAYLFGHPSVSVTDTVEFFISELDPLKLEDDDGIALDLEANDGLRANTVAAWAVAVQAQLKSKLDRNPLLYTFLDFADAGNCAGLGGYPLWIADPSSPAGRPRVPAPWKTWAIHQYDISGTIDRDVANYPGLPQMFAALGKKSGGGPKEPDMNNLGGSIVGGLASARWPDGQSVVAGLGKDGFIQATLWDGKGWTGWKNVSPTKAIAAPAVEVWVDGHGRMYYVDEAQNVIQLDTNDRGQTWT
jgi:GH25 family lysozyme M1 (1,4-beta-N-acetylmuramidase)